jgi:polysaccharide export outer membrane protein
MKKYALQSVFCLLLLILYPHTGFGSDYILTQGDVLSIQVVGYDSRDNPENSLSVPEITIRPDGKISLPMAIEVQAAGLSASELTSMIKERLSYYLENPLVNINLKKMHTTRVYVLGEVARPGLYEIEKSHTLMDAISLSGGWTKDAAKKKIHIVNKKQQGKPLVVNLLDIIEKGQAQKNCTLQDEDIVFVGNNRKINFSQDILALISPLYLIAKWSDK